MRVLWSIPSLPFLFRPLNTPHNPAGIPDALPFRLGVDPSTGRLLQLPTRQLEEILAKAYSDGTVITGMMDDDGIGRQYADDFLAIVHEAVGSERLDGLRVLEIGAGTGYLLHRLTLLGAEVRGVEPGPHAEIGAVRYNVRVDRGFFPSVDVGDGYDVVIMYMLLEHVPDPEELLREVCRVVRPGGTILVAVQDEEPYIRSGEISLLFHEHYSYFSARTLDRTVRAAGGGPVDMRRSSFSNLLVAAFKGTGDGPKAEDIGVDLELSSAFRKRAERIVAAIWTKIDGVHQDGGTVGLFVPARAVNILAMRDAPVDRLRFFDDNTALQGTYYPGFPMPVEDRASLISRPPSCVLIMSLSFGAAISASIRPELPATVEVVALEDMLAE